MTHEEIIKYVSDRLQAEIPKNEYHQLIIDEAIKQINHDRH